MCCHENFRCHGNMAIGNFEDLCTCICTCVHLHWYVADPLLLLSFIVLKGNGLCRNYILNTDIYI
jgi:hypothetical protein